ncbi:adenylosuccinate lyase [[Eubacterium] cellulosolvens]
MAPRGRFGEHIDLVCPLDYRYGRKQMLSLFSEESRLEHLLKVEAALARAHAKLGTIPVKDSKLITQRATLKHVTLAKVKKIEAETKHDLMAVVRALTKEAGAAGKYVHLGATSYDIVDTAVALQIKNAIGLLEQDLIELLKVLTLCARKHTNTVMLGRTHGQAAVPITFGLKLSVFAMEFYRHLERLAQTTPRICVGKFSGAVGTGAALGKHALHLQELVMEDLGLGTELAATQITNRDRHIEFISVLVNIATSVEKLATELRNLQRTEILEVAEAFDTKKQVGSSTMPHKRNPITGENISGLARVVRGFVIPSYENALQWHERDLTNSSSERFIIPHTCIIVDDILVKLTGLMSNLEVYPETMRENIARAGGEIMAEAVMQALTSKGMARDEAYGVVRQCTVYTRQKKTDFKTELLKTAKVKKVLTEKELASALNPENYLGASKDIVSKVVKIINNSKLVRKK